MFPQTELDNYKLQVELLQEKLKRSEDQRNQLEEKFESIMRKRSEHEKIMKVKNKMKFQQFLDEQRERNERNKALVKLLERVDQQAASLAARSERLKMMKLQYEIYFAKLLQTQNFRSIQNSPRHYSMMPPLSHIITNANNLPIGIQDICQSSSNLSKSSPTIPENWGMMPNNTSTGSSNLPYRFPGNMDYFNGQILLSQEPLQRQVNLKSTFGDSMGGGPTHGYPAQIGNFADTRRNPIEFEHYKSLDLNMMASPYMNSNVSPLRTIRSDNHNRNLTEIQNFGQMNSESDFLNRIGYNAYLQRQMEIQHLPYQMSTSDKLPNIKQDDIRERMMAAEVNENDNKTDILKKDDEKSQSMNIAPGDITPMDEIKQRSDGSAENWISTEQSMRKMQDLFAAANRINVDKSRAPVMWNFGGRIDQQDVTNYPIQLGKKEKLSMENIENAIYGERISPIPRIKDLTLDIHPKSPEKQSFLKNLGTNISSRTIRESDNIKEPDSHVEKSDKSEKEENLVSGNETGIVTTKIDCKPSIPVSEIPTDNTLQNSENLENYSPETSSNQRYPEGYPQNYEESQNPTQNSISDENQGQPATYSDSNEINPNEQVVSSAKEHSQPTSDGSENAYQVDQYPPQDYQYPQEGEYTQGQDYANYQTGQYQGEYPQGYDQNSYAYNYNQQAADGTYQQENPGYQQGDVTYPQDETTYQQGNEGYQQGDASYQDPNQQVYGGTEYDAQSYQYPTEYSGAEYGNYENQEVTDPNQNQNETVTDNPEDEEDNGEDDVMLPMPPLPSVMPPSILATEKPPESNANKKKKRVNFVDSETEESSSSAPNPEEPPSVEAEAEVTTTTTTTPTPTTQNSENNESDFDFSSTSN